MCRCKGEAAVVALGSGVLASISGPSKFSAFSIATAMGKGVGHSVVLAQVSLIVSR